MEAYNVIAAKSSNYLNGVSILEYTRLVWTNQITGLECHGAYAHRLLSDIREVHYKSVRALITQALATITSAYVHDTQEEPHGKRENTRQRDSKSECSHWWDITVVMKFHRNESISACTNKGTQAAGGIICHSLSTLHCSLLSRPSALQVYIYTLGQNGTPCCAITCLASRSAINLRKPAALIQVSGYALDRCSDDQLPTVYNGGYSPREWALTVTCCTSKLYMCMKSHTYKYLTSSHKPPCVWVKFWT